MLQISICHAMPCSVLAQPTAQKAAIKLHAATHADLVRRKTKGRLFDTVHAGLALSLTVMHVGLSKPTAHKHSRGDIDAPQNRQFLIYCNVKVPYTAGHQSLLQCRSISVHCIILQHRQQVLHSNKGFLTSPTLRMQIPCVDLVACSTGCKKKPDMPMPTPIQGPADGSLLAYSVHGANSRPESSRWQHTVCTDSNVRKTGCQVSSCLQCPK